MEVIVGQVLQQIRNIFLNSMFSVNKRYSEIDNLSQSTKNVNHQYQQLDPITVH
jgi:hypothetical protein